MTAIEKPLSEIELDDIEELVELSVQEGKQIEYKEYLDLSDDENDHKAKFIDEVTSLANDRGGDFLVGIPDDDGTPRSAGGFPLQKSTDDTINQWQSVIRRYTDPTLPAAAFDIRAIPTENDRAVIIVRVERSWRGPHRNEINDRFYVRSPSGKTQLDTGELRQRFMEAGERAEQIREFRAERIDQIRSRSIPVDLEGGPVLVLHIVPFSAFELGNEINITRAQPTQEGTPRTFHLDENSYRYTLDGIETYARPVDEQQSDYTLTYRSGIIEAVTTRFCYPGSGAPPEAINGAWIRRALEELLQRFCYFLYRQEVRPPYAIALTIVNTEGLPVRKRTEGTRYPIDRGIADLPVEVIEGLDDVPNEPRETSDEPGVRPSVDEPFDEVINSIMNLLWNAAGHSGELQ